MNKQPSHEALKNLCSFFLKVALPRLTPEQLSAATINTMPQTKSA